MSFKTRYETLDVVPTPSYVYLPYEKLISIFQSIPEAFYLDFYEGYESCEKVGVNCFSTCRTYFNDEERDCSCLRVKVRCKKRVTKCNIKNIFRKYNCLNHYYYFCYEAHTGIANQYYIRFKNWFEYWKFKRFINNYINENVNIELEKKENIHLEKFLTDVQKRINQKLEESNKIIEESLNEIKDISLRLAKE